MSGLRLTFEIEALRKFDAQRLAAVIEDYADEQFEVQTSNHGRPMTMRLHTETPKQARERLKPERLMRQILVDMMEWWDDLPNDTRGLLDDDGKETPAFIKAARKFIPSREK